MQVFSNIVTNMNEKKRVYNPRSLKKLCMKVIANNESKFSNFSQLTSELARQLQEFFSERFMLDSLPILNKFLWSERKDLELKELFLDDSQVLSILKKVPNLERLKLLFDIDLTGKCLIEIPNFCPNLKELVLDLKLEDKCFCEMAQKFAEKEIGLERLEITKCEKISDKSFSCYHCVF